MVHVVLTVGQGPGEAVSDLERDVVHALGHSQAERLGVGVALPNRYQ